MNKEDYTLEQLVELSDRKGTLEDISELILALYKQNDRQALKLVLKLALSDFGGTTFKSDFQQISCLGVLHWGTQGLIELGEEASVDAGYRAISNVTYLLSHISSKTLSKLPYSNSKLVNVSALNLHSEKYKTLEWTSTAKEILIKLVRSIENEDRFPISIVTNLGFSMNEDAQEHIFAALMARWFNIDKYGLDSFSELISEKGKSEIEFHNFLKINPYILEPFHAQIWSKPRLGEELIPDFLIQSMDNSYTVVEIEKPDLQILTKSGELSSKTTHAKRQALDFRDWTINNNLYAGKRFDGIYRPYCLVVIGRESELTSSQAQRLRQENESTQGILKIVGFDWLHNRAKATFDNLVKYGFNRENFKGVLD